MCVCVCVCVCVCASDASRLPFICSLSLLRLLLLYPFLLTVSMFLFHTLTVRCPFQSLAAVAPFCRRFLCVCFLVWFGGTLFFSDARACAPAGGRSRHVPLGHANRLDCQRFSDRRRCTPARAHATLQGAHTHTHCQSVIHPSFLSLSLCLCLCLVRYLSLSISLLYVALFVIV